MIEPVWITGTGLITSIGNDRSSVVKSLREMRHGIENPLMLQVDESPVKVAGMVKDFEVDSSDPEDWVYPQEYHCLLYTSPSPRDRTRSRMPSSA